MDIEILSEFLNESGIHAFYPFEFPISASSDCSYVEITGGTSKKGGVGRLYIRVITRAEHPSKSLNKSKEICKYLSNEKEDAFFIGTEELIQSIPETPTPLYLGEENGRYLFSYNYTLIFG